MQPTVFIQRFMSAAIASVALSGAIAQSAQADSFSNTRIEFDVDTIIEFQFDGSNGIYQATFGVENLANGERTPLFFEVGGSQTPNQPVRTTSNTPGVTEFYFVANTPYALYLESEYDGRPSGTVYSDSSRNPSGERLMDFSGGVDGLVNGGVLIRMDDTGSLLVRPSQEDRDFNDFRVRAGGHLGCPFDQAIHDRLQSRLDSDAIACRLDP